MIHFAAMATADSLLKSAYEIARDERIKVRKHKFAVALGWSNDSQSRSFCPFLKEIVPKNYQSPPRTTEIILCFSMFFLMFFLLLYVPIMQLALGKSFLKTVAGIVVHPMARFMLEFIYMPFYKTSNLILDWVLRTDPYTLFKFKSFALIWLNPPLKLFDFGMVNGFSL